MLLGTRPFAAVAVVGALLALVNASALSADQQYGLGRRMTNAERLTRGLGPNKPQLRRSTKVRGRDNPSMVPPPPSSSSSPGSAPSPPSSPQPCPVSGNILISGDTTGFLSQSNGQGFLGVTTDIDDAGVFTIDTCTYSGTYINIGCSNCNDGTVQGSPGFTVIGGVVAPGSVGNLGSIITDPGALLAIVKPVDNGPPSTVTVASYTEEEESMIWMYNSVTGSITAQWTNHNGGLPATFVSYYGQLLSFTSSRTYGVTLTFRPIDVTKRAWMY